MLIVFLGIFGAYQLGLKVVGVSKNKIIATAIASGRIEKIRNLPYLLIGTKDAQLPFCQGVLDSATTTFSNNVEYQVATEVKFVIDEADGTGVEDSCNWDYKRAEVKVSWSGRFSGEVKLVTDVSPKDKVQEVASCQAQPGGILSVRVFDAYGIMITSPLIEVFDPQTGQLIDSNIPQNGKHDFPLAASTYKVVVSKQGYSSEKTYGIEEVAAPTNPHPIVLEGQLTEASFSIDRLGSFSIETVTSAEEEVFPVPEVTFNLKGEKLLGYDTDETPVYKYSENHTTDSQGKIDIPNLEWDNYTFSLVPATDLNLVEIESPVGSTATQPIGLVPDVIANVRLFLSAENTLLVTVQDQDTLEPVFAATARLLKIDYDETQYTNSKGQTYFIPLEEANYNLEVEGPGYAVASTTVWVSGYTTKTIKLQQIE